MYHQEQSRSFRSIPHFFAFLRQPFTRQCTPHRQLRSSSLSKTPNPLGKKNAEPQGKQEQGIESKQAHNPNTLSQEEKTKQESEMGAGRLNRAPTRESIRMVLEPFRCSFPNYVVYCLKHVTRRILPSFTKYNSRYLTPPKTLSSPGPRYAPIWDWYL
jgi:hypothetical protein